MSQALGLNCLYWYCGPWEASAFANSFSPQQFLDIIQEIKLFRDRSLMKFTNSCTISEYKRVC